MIAAHAPVQRPRDAKLLVIEATGRTLQHAPRQRLADFLHAGDVLVANDAATLPASLPGHHLRTGARLEVRLAGRGSLDACDVRAFSAVVFGAGDHRRDTRDGQGLERRRPSQGYCRSDQSGVDRDQDGGH